MAVAQTGVRDGEIPRERPDQPEVKRHGPWLGIYTALVMAYLFLPVVVIILFGFNDPVGRFNFVFNRFTLDNYRTLFENDELTAALQNSLSVAAISTLVAVTFGTLIALALTRHRFRGRSSLNLFLFVPMATPEIVLGVSLLALFVTLNVDRGFLTILIAHIMFSISYVVVTVKARTSGLDTNLEDAAQDLGATPLTTFWTVTFPLIFPGILAAGLLVFILSLDDYVVTVFNAGGTAMFPLWIYGASRIGVPPAVNIMGTLIFAIGVVYVIFVLLRERGLLGDPEKNANRRT
jgi:spermidine/putrescine transport system permease protein